MTEVVLKTIYNLFKNYNSQNQENMEKTTEEVIKHTENFEKLLFYLSNKQTSVFEELKNQLKQSYYTLIQKSSEDRVNLENREKYEKFHFELYQKYYEKSRLTDNICMLLACLDSVKSFNMSSRLNSI